MKISTELTDLRLFKPWAGAKYNWELIIASGKSKKFIDYLEDLFPNGLTETELNDLLWFDDEFIEEFLAEDYELEEE